MFDELLKRLDAVNLAKAIESGPKDPTDPVEPVDEPEEGDEMITKSFRVTLEDGEEADAVDGTELVKSLTARHELMETAIRDRDEHLLKAISGVVETIEGQAQLIKSLTDEVKRLRGAGAGRRSVVTISEPPGTTRMNEDATMSPDEFMAKAMDAQKSGKINGLDIAKAEGYLQKGMNVPEDIVRRVLR